MDQYSANMIANAIRHVGDALGQIAIEQRRANDLKEKEFEQAKFEKRSRAARLAAMGPG